MSLIDGPEDKKSVLDFLWKKASEQPIMTTWKNSSGKLFRVHLTPFISRREVGIEIEDIGSFVAYPADFEKLLEKFGFRFFDQNEELY